MGTPVYMEGGQIMNGGTIISPPMEGQIMQGTLDGAIVEPQSSGEAIQDSNVSPEVATPPAPTPDDDSPADDDSSKEDT